MRLKYIVLTKSCLHELKHLDLSHIDLLLVQKINYNEQWDLPQFDTTKIILVADLASPELSNWPGKIIPIDGSLIYQNYNFINSDHIPKIIPQLNKDTHNIVLSSRLFRDNTNDKIRETGCETLVDAVIEVKYSTYNRRIIRDKIIRVSGQAGGLPKCSDYIELIDKKVSLVTN